MALDNVIFFPLPRSGLPGLAARQGAGFKFLFADKIDICVWEQEHASRAVNRVVIHENSGVSEEDADMALLYAQDCPWARWGIARCVDGIVLWRCRDGVELGRFSTALQALLAVPGCARRAPEAAVRFVLEA